MTPLEAGFYKLSSERGLSDAQISDLWKMAMAYPQANQMFNQVGQDGMADPHQLDTMSAMHQQALAEQQLHQFRSEMMNSDIASQLPIAAQT